MEMGTMKMSMEEAEEKKGFAAEEGQRNDTEDPSRYEDFVEHNFCDKTNKSNGNQRKRKRHKYDQNGGDGVDLSTVVDVPMDLSRRSIRHGLAVAGTKLSSGKEVCETEQCDEDRNFDSSLDDEPLNLSVNGHHSIEDSQKRWRSCPRLNDTGVCSERLQKRVRLEEMVSYIRRYSSYIEDGHRVDEDRAEAEEEEEEEGEGREVEGDDEGDSDDPDAVMVKHSYSCSQLEALKGSAFGNHRRKMNIPYRDTSFPLKKQKMCHSKNKHSSGTTNSRGKSSYPVLRQKLLSMVAAPPRPTSSGSLTLKEDVAAVKISESEGKEDQVDENGGADDEGTAKDRGDENESQGNGDVFCRQGRLVSPPSSSSGNSIPWTAYAYYANLYQELQGSLSSANTPMSPVSLPHPAGGEPLPLSLTTSTRSSSPLSDNGETPASTFNDSNGSGLRKRAPRALTGKHVKQGTGASPSTLLSLRQKIEQRQMQQQPQSHHQQKHHSHQKHSSNSRSDKKESAHKLSKMTAVTPRKKLAT